MCLFFPHPSPAQDRNLNLAALAKLVGTKEIRFASPEDTASLLGVAQGCITSLSLVNDVANKVRMDGPFSTVVHPCGFVQGAWFRVESSGRVPCPGCLLLQVDAVCVCVCGWVCVLCVTTALWQVEAVWDSAITALPSLRICAGCADPKNHSQHNVVDITFADLLRIVKTGGRSDPKIVDIQ